jgi:hypothetical protein
MLKIKTQLLASETDRSGTANYSAEKWGAGAAVWSREEGLDDTLSETFPCSDPLSSIPDPAKVQ